MNIIDILIAVALIALGISFAWKFVLAAFFGRTKVWSGFLPITIVSPFFIHLPSSEKSMIKTTHNAWVQIFLAPAFILCSLICLATGADRLGMPGTAMINYVLTLGKPGQPAAIEYNPGTGYSFPIVPRTMKAIYTVLTKSVLEEKKGKDPKAP